ncbi:MAG: sugar phosphate isomerase/epimerase family protein [Bacteroidota bacterium]
MPFPSHIVCCYLYPISRYGYPPQAQDSLQHIREMKALGFTSIELEGIRADHLAAMYALRHEIHTAIGQDGLTVPYFCVVLPGLSSPNQAERILNLKRFEQGCEIAALLGAKGVLDNAPLPPYKFPADIPVVRHYDSAALMRASIQVELSWDTYWDQLVGTYQEACEIAAGFGLTYQMHPCEGVLAATTDAFLYFADAVNRDNLRFNLDTANQYFLRDNLRLSLLRLKDRLDYLHISDNRGHRVEHLVPGQGTIDFEGFFETLREIGFRGHLGVDVGGAESDIGDLDQAYQTTAAWLSKQWPNQSDR